jgi:hypothetical protein
MASLEPLIDNSLVIIFATSPTGLGHLRVTDALYHGLPKNTPYVLLGAQDPSVSAMYRFVSIHPITRKLMELVQMPPIDRPFAYYSRQFLRSRTKILYQQLKTILTERLVVPKTVLLIAPHTILGHQLGEIKQRIANEMGVNILLVVQVTDDSPQAIWYVPDADLLLVPSVYTKEHLYSYAKKAKLPIVPIVVAAYPISPLLSQSLSETDFEKRVQQTDPTSNSTIHITVPVSGAAVGTSFMSHFIQSMHQQSKRFLFHVVSREAGYTHTFIQEMSELPYVTLYTSMHDRTTVDNYERVFLNLPIALEITKPSEQAFKALATPKQRGGTIMLFSTPIGGQEYDNLHFLRNHGFMPSKADHKMLWQLAENNSELPMELKEKSHHWRCLRLPDDAQTAALFTRWALEQKLFFAMMHYSKSAEGDETKSNGVEQFWTQVIQLLQTHHAA